MPIYCLKVPAQQKYGTFNSLSVFNCVVTGLQSMSRLNIWGSRATKKKVPIFYILSSILYSGFCAPAWSSVFAEVPMCHTTRFLLNVQKLCCRNYKGWQKTYAKCEKLAYHCHWQQVRAFTIFSSFYLCQHHCQWRCIWMCLKSFWCVFVFVIVKIFLFNFSFLCPLGCYFGTSCFTSAVL